MRAWYSDLVWNTLCPAAEKLARLYCPGHNVPTGSNWTETFGRIYADMQDHVMERGLLAALATSSPLSSTYRYRINWRAKCAFNGVFHGSKRMTGYALGGVLDGIKGWRSDRRMRWYRKAAEYALGGVFDGIEGWRSMH